eukprot:TRINITY_DN1699_c0_g1_i1.p1 TRINITY_DN1699_c0_g1~~TRINITY_DN1699_c0_g1_i1.p1  ORF type:complete len:374 (-),score=63.57 TRINITY_DN1699_c0_g1_i1:650-1771(-)
MGQAKTLEKMGSMPCNDLHQVRNKNESEYFQEGKEEEKKEQFFPIHGDEEEKMYAKKKSTKPEKPNVMDENPDPKGTTPLEELKQPSLQDPPSKKPDLSSNTKPTTDTETRNMDFFSCSICDNMCETIDPIFCVCHSNKICKSCMAKQCEKCKSAICTQCRREFPDFLECQQCQCCPACDAKCKLCNEKRQKYKLDCFFLDEEGKRAFFEKKIDKNYFDSIAYSSEMLKKEAIKVKAHTPIPVIPSLTENEGKACIVSEIFKQKKCIIDFSNIDMTNSMISEFKNDMFGIGLKDDYHYSLKLGMNYSKMEVTMGEKEVIDQVRYRLSKALSLPISMFTNISLHRGSVEVKFSIKDRNNKNVDPLSKKKSDFFT